MIRCSARWRLAYSASEKRGYSCATISRRRGSSRSSDGGILGAPELFAIKPLDAWRLVFELDLVAAQLDAYRHRPLPVPAAHEGAALRLGERVAQAAECGREVPRRLVAGVEVLVEHAVGRGEHGAVPPAHLAEVLLAFVPEQRIAMPGHAHHVEVRPVAV